MTVIDDYLTNVEPSKRQELERIRTLAQKIVPDAEEAIVYGMPTLTYQGKPFLGFDAHKQHIGIYPYSSQVIEELKDQLQELQLIQRRYSCSSRSAHLRGASEAHHSRAIEADHDPLALYAFLL